MKKALIAAVVVLLVLLSVGGYFLLDSMFPVAAPITCPNEEDIVSISLLQNSDPSSAIEISDFRSVMQGIRIVEPTRGWSIQDYPPTEIYYTIQIETSARLHRYFVYTEDSQVYVESPYNGIYKANQQILDFVAGYFKD